MDSIDRIAPVAPTSSSVNLRVAEPNKDGQHKHGEDHPSREEAHDVLELHSEDGEEIELQVQEKEPPTEFGLDIAV